MKFRKTAVCTAAVLAAFAAGPAPFIQTVNAEYSRVAVHDPSVIKLNDGDYYIIGSHLAAARSKDLKNWKYTANSQAGSKKTTFFKDIYKDLEIPYKWSNTTNGYDLSGNLWAPDIIYNPQMKKYCMYLSVNGEKWNSSVVLCTADNPDGPYTYSGTIVYSGFTNNKVNNVNDTDVPKVLGKNPDISRYLVNGGWEAAYGTNAIDPCVFYDESGKLWMIYGSWFGGLYMLELDEKTGLRDYGVKYETKKDVSDAYMGKKVAGGYFNSGEGPYIEYMKAPGSSKGYYYMFVSYGYFNSNGGYNMRIFRSEKPDGPYTDQNGNSAVYKKGGDNIAGTTGQRLMSNYQWSCNSRPNKAQGHNSALMDSDGKLYVIYHNKFDDNFGFHEVRVHQMFINEKGWPVAAPYEYSGETVSDKGYSTNAIAGDYEFIVHTLGQKFVNEKSADVEKPKKIKLGADGSVSGDIKGNWTVRNGSPYMTFTYGGVTYSGVFLAQGDESEKQTVKMTFTATGNNTCIWGSKVEAYNPDTDNVDITDHESRVVYNPESCGKPGTTVYVSGTSVLSGVTYTVKNVNSGLVLDVTDGKTDENTNIQQFESLRNSAQQWRIVSEDDGFCRIVSCIDESMCMSLESESADNGVNVVLKKYTGGKNQLWKLAEKDGHYSIQPALSDGKTAVDMYDWSKENGGNANQWEYNGYECQLWDLTPVYAEVPEGDFLLRNINSGYYVSTDGKNVLQSDRTVWKVSTAGDGTYFIRSEDGMAVTVKDGSAEDGTDVLLSAYTGKDNQKFRFQACSDGSYAVLSAVSGYKSGLDIFEISRDDKANICQWNFWGGEGQKFVCEPAGRTPEKEPEPVRGDVNMDGKHDAEDLILLVRYLHGAVQDSEVPGGDISGDGKIGIADLCMLRAVLAGA